MTTVFSVEPIEVPYQWGLPETFLRVHCVRWWHLKISKDVFSDIYLTWFTLNSIVCINIDNQLEIEVIDKTTFILFLCGSDRTLIY